MTTSTTIGRATGVVMERFQLSADRAFELLTRVSRIHDVTLKVLADRDPRRGGEAATRAAPERADKIVFPPTASPTRSKPPAVINCRRNWWNTGR